MDLTKLGLIVKPWEQPAPSVVALTAPNLSSTEKDRK